MLLKAAEVSEFLFIYMFNKIIKILYSRVITVGHDSEDL